MNKSISYIIILTVGIVLLLPSCGDFLEERSQNQAYVENATDLNELLIGEGYLTGGYSLDTTYSRTYTYWSNLCSKTNLTHFAIVHIMDDDTEEAASGSRGTSNANYVRMKYANFHHWQADPAFDANNAEIKDQNWTESWKRINAMNSIIYQVSQLTGGDENEAQLRRKVEGEARFLRAQYYFWMANLYGQPYCKTTASTDPCIPFKITEAVEDHYFSRATSQIVYEQMVTDLTIAAKYLRGIIQPTKYRTNQTAAYTLLSRVYLYMERYEEAIAAADSALQNNSYSLLNFNDIERNSVVYIDSPEVIFTHGSNDIPVLLGPTIQNSPTNYTNSYSASEDLLAQYDPTDLRLERFFFKRGTGNVESTSRTGIGMRCIKTWSSLEEVSDRFAIRLPEAYLNKAEALACLNRETEAIATVNELRSKRFAIAPTITKTGDELIQFIRDERRRELCFEGHRWFDLRRYAVNTRCPFTKSIRHKSFTIDGTNAVEEGYYELKPYPEDKAAYILPIPQDAIDFNKGELSNEPRNQRELQHNN